MNELQILGVQITDRVTEVSEVQAILTKFGCCIKTRLGLHEVRDDFCATSGLIILELTGNSEEFMKLENELLRIEGVVVKKMTFESDK